MKPLPGDTVALRPPSGTDSNTEQAKPADFFDRVRHVHRVCRQVFGIPDYDRYLEHAAARHPGAPVLSRKEFCDRAIDRKYGHSGPRCC
jgi:uncharacterized short protein YbdD (DUF466 family)